MAGEIDIKKAVAWINSHWVGAKQCPVCGSNNWDISPHPVEVRKFNQGPVLEDGPVYPLVNVTCRSCGYTLLFNAILMGAVELPQKEEP